MLVVDVSKIPPEGLELAEELTPLTAHAQPGDDFALGPGGRLECRVELGDEETVHVKGRLAAPLELTCGRCLGPFVLPVDQKLELFYLPHRADVLEEDEVELSERDMVVAYYRGHTIDLGEMVREQFFLSIPLKRLCREDCRGLCPKCGCDRNQENCGCSIEDPDPRLESLGRLLGR